MVHLGTLALMLLIAAGMLWRMRRQGRSARRDPADLILFLLAAMAFLFEAGLTIQEQRFEARWADVASSALTARSERIVDFLRTKGVHALDEIRTISDDPDTRALLSDDFTLGRTARRPVFLDLQSRFPSGDARGVTVYDVEGTPRAWSGWSPTATMTVSREPSRAWEALSIRQGSIYTLLEVAHPIRERLGDVIGYVVYQEPLRVQFPLENDLLRVDDVLHRLEGGGGVRADVALELRLDEGIEIDRIRVGAMKMHLAGPVASGTTSIVSAAGEPVGRVSLSGLNRESVFFAGAPWVPGVRALLLAAVAILLAIRLWILLQKLPAVLVPLGRLLLLAGSRALLLAVYPRPHLDPLSAFDPSWFASIRFGGLLRSPGDLFLTAAVLLLGARELRRVALRLRPHLESFSRRFIFLSAPVGLAVALLVGSLVGVHWERVTDIARNANVPLYGGLDPFTSAPVATLELALLFVGMTLLVAADTLVTVALGLFARLGRVGAFVLIAGCALFASSVKVGSPAQAEIADFLRPLPMLLTLLAFHFLSRRWRRPGAGAILVTAVLAAISNVTPLFEGVQSRREELVELFALEHTESPSNSRHFLLESTLDYLATSEALLNTLEDGADPEDANLAFILWAKSPLANVNAGCQLRLRRENGRVFSTFSLGFPAEFDESVDEEAPLQERTSTSFRREELGSERVHLYRGAVPLGRAGRVLGALELRMAYYDDLAHPRSAPRDLGGVFTNLSAPDEFLRFTREVPDRIDRYRGDALVASTDPEGGLGKRMPPIIVQALAGGLADGRWIEREIQNRRWDMYCVRERDGDRTVGYLTFGIRRHGLLEAGLLLARSVLVTLLLTAAVLAALMFTSWMLPKGSTAPRLDIPRIGFRERVIAGFLVVSLVPTVLLGFAGRGLFVQQKRSEFEERLEEDLRVSMELLGRRLSDVARNAAGSDEVRALLESKSGYARLSTPASVDGIVVVSGAGQLLGASRAADLDMAMLPGAIETSARPVEFFRRRGGDLYACSLVPMTSTKPTGRLGGAVLAFQRVDAVLSAELERRVGSSVSFFAGGRLAATSKPELYQSEILSDLVEPEAYLKIELEGARRTLVESRVGSTSFLSSYAPLMDAKGNPVGIAATIAPYQGGGLDLDASLVLSRIYFLCLLVFAAAITAAVVFANRLTQPILELTRGAEKIRAGTLGERIVTRASGEIGRLVRSFNQMSEQLAESVERDRERREYIEAIIRHVGSGVISFDANGRVATVNQAAARILAVDPDALVGAQTGDVRGNPGVQAVFDAVHPLLEGRREELIGEIEIEEQSGGKENPPGADPGGDVRSLRLVATPLVDADGGSQGAVAVFEDLTDLIKSKKITAWAEMARQVAHEIKNPLTPMKLSAQHLQQAWRDKHPKFDRILEESTETIVDRCEALRRIAIEFSDYARMPGRRIRREDLGILLHEARRLYGETEEREVEFQLEAPSNELWSRVDKDEVMRLFINLIENSIQAMPSGGELAVRAFRENGAAWVTIEDSGVGISHENLKRIFEPSFSTKTGGAGLGLPICKAIMEDYGGSIGIQSRSGEGTTVTLSFPVDESRLENEEESDA